MVPPVRRPSGALRGAIAPNVLAFVALYLGGHGSPVVAAGCAVTVLLTGFGLLHLRRLGRVSCS